MHASGPFAFALQRDDDGPPASGALHAPRRHAARPNSSLCYTLSLALYPSYRRVSILRREACHTQLDGEKMKPMNSSLNL